jgi:uncharacterized protein
MSMDNSISRGLTTLGLLLAIGLSLGAFILGNQTRNIGSGRQTILVKGLAQKHIKADRAEWHVGIKVHGATFAQALTKLRQARPQLSDFLSHQGFAKETLKESAETVDPNMIDEELANGRYRSVQKGYNASQEITVTTGDLARATTAAKAVLQLKADGTPVYYSAPLYLVSDLEAVKMSLIGAATQNARMRAEEFAKNGNVRVGSMRSARQGAFYILAPDASIDATDYGGIYDKSTINKIARVVVTIEYNIEK